GRDPGDHLVTGGRYQVVGVQRAACRVAGFAGDLLGTGQPQPEDRSVDAAEHRDVAVVVPDVVLVADPLHAEHTPDDQQCEHRQQVAGGAQPLAGPWVCG